MQKMERQNDAMNRKCGRNRQLVYKMLEDGEDVAAIVAATGLKPSTVRSYRDDWYVQDGYVIKFDREWTCAVNRIRRYCGMKELPM